MIGSIVYQNKGEWVVQKRRSSRDDVCSPPGSPIQNSRSIAWRIQLTRIPSRDAVQATMAYHVNVLKKSNPLTPRLSLKVNASVFGNQS